MLTPITALYAGILGFISLALAGLVVRARGSENVIFGDGANVVVLQRIRVHGNFTEYVPIALLLMLVLELNGASPLVMNGLGASLVIGRLLHAFGLTSSTGTSVGRFVGTILTWLVIAVASGLTIYAWFSATPK
ncbi:MAG: MAPEG family protein [Myxococcota bacterium]